MNKLYKKAFEVDIMEVCGPNGKQKPMVPTFKPWVRIYPIKDVKVENIKKFRLADS